jgi:hypothetical protein
MSEENIFLKALATLSDASATPADRASARELLLTLCDFAAEHSAEDTTLFMADVQARLERAMREWMERIAVEAATEARELYETGTATYTPGGKQ